LEGAHLLRLDVFEQGEALRLLERLIGPQRMPAEPVAARSIVNGVAACRWRCASPAPS
jgi:hypothetical protein